MLPPAAPRDSPRVPVQFIPTCFTESLRIPVTQDNRQFLCNLRAAELELWFQVRRQADRGDAALRHLPLRVL